MLVFCEEPLFQNRASSKVNLEWQENDNHSDDKLVQDSQSVTTENDPNDNEEGHSLTSRYDLRKQYIKVPKKFED